MIEENKQLNKAVENQADSTAVGFSNLTIFKDDPKFYYTYKKTEKLVSALYMLSNFISDKEPVRWQLREAGVNVLSQCLVLSDRSVSGYQSAYLNFISTGLKIVSFLEVAFLGGIISQMNYDILKYEFELLIQNVETGESGVKVKGVIFPERFLDVQEVLKVSVLDTSKMSVTRESDSKGQNNLSLKKEIELSKTAVIKQKDKLNKPSTVGRQEIIIALLKKNNELGIKDFTLSVKDCSEKTIQRELASLVSKGLIKKDGEKRWSRYSLKQA